MARYRSNAGNGAIGAIVLWFAFVAFLAIGWIMNIIDLVKGNIGPIGEWTMVIWLKVIGIFLAPLGGFLGWLT